MRVVFLGRKPSACRALRAVVGAGHEVVAVVAPDPQVWGDRIFYRPTLRQVAGEMRLPVVGDEDLYAALAAGGRARTLDLRDLDLVLSFLFWKKIRPELLKAPAVGAFNFHPGPLPEYRRARGYSHAILEGAAEYGATLHWMSPEFDEGDLVEVRRFPLRPDETALSLERRTTRVLEEILDDLLVRLGAGEEIPRIRQGSGRGASKHEMLALARIQPTDSADMASRRARAFWFPPFSGATVEIDGREFTLVDETTLRALGEFIHAFREEPF